MNEKDWTELPEESESAAPYIFSGRDKIIINAAIQLLSKITRAPFTRPAELATVAKALHVLGRFPSTAPAQISISIDLTGPTRRFGEHEIWHSWSVGIDGQSIELASGGHFYRKSTGGDSFTCFQWSACPGGKAVFLNYLDQLQIVDDARPFPEEIASLDLTEGGFSLTVQDEDNPLLEQMDAEDEDSQSDGPMVSAAADVGLTIREQHLAQFADQGEGRRQGVILQNAPVNCDLCGCNLSTRQFLVDGRRQSSLLWAYMCAECFLESGVGIRWGEGQLYQRLPNNDWLMVGGFPPDEESNNPSPTEGES